MWDCPWSIGNLSGAIHWQKKMAPHHQQPSSDNSFSIRGRVLSAPSSSMSRVRFFSLHQKNMYLLTQTNIRIIMMTAGLRIATLPRKWSAILKMVFTSRKKTNYLSKSGIIWYALSLYILGMSKFLNKILIKCEIFIFHFQKYIFCCAESVGITR